MWPLQELLLCTTETCLNQDLKIKYLIQKNSDVITHRSFFVSNILIVDYHVNLRVYFPTQKLATQCLRNFSEVEVQKKVLI